MTDKKRIEILEKVKELISSREEIFLCNAINRLLEARGRKEIYEVVNKMKRVIRVFPELKKHKPKTAGIYAWWLNTDTKPRIDVCDSMIKEITSKNQ